MALLLALVGVIVPASAQDGSTAYQFLDIATSSHIYALGGHQVALIDDDVNLIQQNPALLGPEFNKQVGLSYMRYIGSTNFMGGRYAQGINDRSAWSVGFHYFGYGSIEGYDQEGISTGTFSARDMAISATYSHDISSYFRGGITLNYLNSKYDAYSASAITADLGVNYYDPEHEISFSLVARNLGGQIKKFHDRKESLPWDIQVGYSQMFSSLPIRLSVTAYGLRKWHLPYYEPADKNNVSSALIKRDSFGRNLLRHLAFGVDVMPNSKMYIGVGYNYRTRTDMSTYQRNFLSGFSLGAGLRVRAFGFGVALAQPHSGATTFMFNLTTNINELMR